MKLGLGLGWARMRFILTGLDSQNGSRAKDEPGFHSLRLPYKNHVGVGARGVGWGPGAWPWKQRTVPLCF